MNAVIDLHKLIPAWQALQCATPLAHIENEAEYEQTAALLNSLLDAVRDGVGQSALFVGFRRR